VGPSRKPQTINSPLAQEVVCALLSALRPTYVHVSERTAQPGGEERDRKVGDRAETGQMTILERSWTTVRNRALARTSSDGASIEIAH
jgi:hypothetical protein